MTRVRASATIATAPEIYCAVCTEWTELKMRPISQPRYWPLGLSRPRQCRRRPNTGMIGWYGHRWGSGVRVGVGIGTPDYYAYSYAPNTYAYFAPQAAHVRLGLPMAIRMRMPISRPTAIGAIPPAIAVHGAAPTPMNRATPTSLDTLMRTGQRTHTNQATPTSQAIAPTPITASPATPGADRALPSAASIGIAVRAETSA